MNFFSKLPVVILAGGFGSRLDSLTETLPKPLVKISKQPIIFYILKIFIKQGLRNFYIATGYKNKEFLNYFIIKTIIFTAGILIIIFGEILLNLSIKNIYINFLLYSAPFFFFIINWLILSHILKY